MQRLPRFLARQVTWQKVFIAFLYLAGLFLWGIFFNWGNFPDQFHDWTEVNLPRLAAAQDALRQHALPFHVQDAAILRCGPDCDRYWSSIDTIMSPQLLLLKWMPFRSWVLLDVWLMYTLGFWGVVVLRKLFQWSLPLFGLFFFFFFFNGHILAHYAVGHINWGGYFLFPWLIYLVECFRRGDNSWSWVMKTALLIFTMFLQGSFHQFVWSLILLGFISIVYFRRFFTVLKAMIFTCLVSTVRLLPPILAFNGFDRDFYGGYPNLFGVYEALTHLVLPADAMPFQHMGSNLGYWEFDLFIGKFGMWLLVVAGLVWLLMQFRARKVDLLLLPIAALTLLAMGRIYLLFRQLPIPLLYGERVTARMISLPFVFFTAYAITALQNASILFTSWKARLVTGIFSLAFLLEGYTLFLNLAAWRLPQTALAFPYTYVDLTPKPVANHADPLYFGLLWVGASMSLLSVAVLAILAHRSSSPKTAGQNV
jgi:hypothetical protein